MVDGRRMHIVTGKLRTRLRQGAAIAALALAAATGVGVGQAAAACGLCVTSVTINSSLATCFLERYDRYAARSGTAVAVDLRDCPSDRGVVEPLSSPATVQIRPDTRFLITKAQLACFRDRIETSGAAALDPLAVIPLDDCE